LHGPRVRQQRTADARRHGGNIRGSGEARGSGRIRRGIGAAVLAAVVVIALGLDTQFLTRVSLASTAHLEQGLVDRLRPNPSANNGPVVMTGDAPAQPQPLADAELAKTPVGTVAGSPAATPQPSQPPPASNLPVEGELPSLSGAVQWLNSPPLSPEALRGKIVVIDFWTYSCINCLRAIPYVQAWHEKYKDKGVVVIGVHTPEFAFEKNIENVKKAVTDLKIDFPVPIDNDYAIWRTFHNMYWPADYFIDAQGRIRDNAFGEGEYRGSEHTIQLLLQEAGRTNVPIGFVAVTATGAQAAPDEKDDRSPEIYVG